MNYAYRYVITALILGSLSSAADAKSKHVVSECSTHEDKDCSLQIVSTGRLQPFEINHDEQFIGRPSGFWLSYSCYGSLAYLSCDGGSGEKYSYSKIMDSVHFEGWYWHVRTSAGDWEYTLVVPRKNAIGLPADFFSDGAKYRVERKYERRTQIDHMIFTLSDGRTLPALILEQGIIPASDQK